MDTILQQKKEAFFNNLVLLGLDILYLEKKHGIQFHKTMFDLPNKKGFEVLSHFLFTKLRAATNKDYNIPWPLLNKENERDFQKTCYNHLTNFAQENCVKFPRLVPSLLSTFGGNRFYDAYFAFSCYVLHKTIKSGEEMQLLSFPKVTDRNFTSIKKIIMLSTIKHMDTFTDAENLAMNCLNLWTAEVKKLMQNVEDLKLLIKTYEEIATEKGKTLALLLSLDGDADLNVREINKKCRIFYNTFVSNISKLETFFLNEEDYWNSLKSEIDDSKEKEILNGQKYNISITDLPEDFQTQLDQADIRSSQIGGKLSIIRFLKLFSVQLKFIIKVFQKSGIDKFHKLCFIEGVSNIGEPLKNVANLNTMFFEELIPDVKKKIELLKSIEPSNIQLSAELPVFNFDEVSVNDRFSEPKILTMLKTEFSKSHFSEFIICDDNQINTKENSLCAQAPYIPFLENSVISNKNESFESTLSNLFQSDKNTQNAIKISEKENVSLFKFSSVEENISICKVPFAKENESFFKAASASEKVSTAENTFSGITFSDSDYVSSTQFKLRESWLQEESLYTVTLPEANLSDMSSDEVFPLEKSEDELS